LKPEKASQSNETTMNYKSWDNILTADELIPDTRPEVSAAGAEVVAFNDGAAKDPGFQGGLGQHSSTEKEGSEEQHCGYETGTV
jgi:hypothetical protein